MAQGNCQGFQSRLNATATPWQPVRTEHVTTRFLPPRATATYSSGVSVDEDGIVEITNFSEKLEVVRKIQLHMLSGLPPTPEMYEQFKVMSPQEFANIMQVAHFFNM